MKEITRDDLQKALSNSTGLFVLPIMDCITKCIVNANDYFLPPDNAIYRKTTNKPVLLANKHYYKENTFTPFSYSLFSSVDDLETLELSKGENIVDSDFNVVLTYIEYHNRKNLLYIEPTINPNIINYILYAIKEEVQYTLSYDSCVDKKCTDFLSNAPVEVLDKLDSVLEDVLEEVFNYIQMDTWRIYDIYISYSDLFIKKLVDWRAYEWIKIQLEKKE